MRGKVQDMSILAYNIRHYILNVQCLEIPHGAYSVTLPKMFKRITKHGII